MTARQAPQGEPAAARSAMALQGLDSVAGAGRVKAALRTEHGAQHLLVDPDQCNQDAGHRSRRRPQYSVSSAASWPAVTLRALGVAMMTTSQGGRPLCCLKLSRTIRLNRLRATARGRAFLATVSPSLAALPPLLDSNTVKLGLRRRRPLPMTCLNAAGVSSRALRGNPAIVILFPGAIGNYRQLRAEAGAALGTTASNHLPTSDGRHAGAKAVCTLTAQRVRLIGAFHSRAQQGKRARSLAA